MIDEGIHVHFVLDGVTYDYDVPKVGTALDHNVYYLVIGEDNIRIKVDSETNLWTINLLTIGTYNLSTLMDYPISDNWRHVDGTELDILRTTRTVVKNTISYSKVSEGWNSFWSYNPDWFANLNSNFYSFKNGELYLHNSNPIRNQFYGIDNPSSIKTIFNAEPLMVKMFNTVLLNSTHPWSAEIVTNINDGFIDSTYFVEKEGQFYAYIRRIDDTIDIKQLSTQGIGNPYAVNASPIDDVVVTTSIDFSNLIAVGDTIYKNNAGTLELIGVVTSLSPSSIHIDTTTGSIPTTANFLVCVKNSQAESFGARGNYMDIELTNDIKEQSKLFAIGASVFKSFL